jgi:hypothetical protein
VVKSRVRGSEREIVVSVDAQGRAVGYLDRASSQKGMLARIGATFLAVLDAQGGVQGSWMQTTVTYPDSGKSPVDLAALKALRERATGSQSSRPLEAGEQRKVRQLVTFLRKRCPA